MTGGKSRGGCMTGCVVLVFFGSAAALISLISPLCCQLSLCSNLARLLQRILGWQNGLMGTTKIQRTAVMSHYELSHNISGKRNEEQS